ncbi:hypothetical protein [Janibacter sp. LM]|uniref:hypothetical protein n=1 Tax=Janibacter sp. LM TaxID=3144845 RepID=UPI0031F6F6FA
MGADDANAGPAPRECPGHDWRVVESVLTHDGAYVEQVCRLCETVTMVTPRELGGWV